jgi:prepilin-type N-terminal cleavage/methylation domain-containing protein
MRPRNNHINGFTLVEVLVAAAISLTVMLVGTQLYLGSVSAYSGLKQRTSLSQDALMLVDYLRNMLLVAGGGSVRAWMGIWVEDNCNARSVYPACLGSDRLTVSSASIPLQECGITSMVSVAPHPTVLQVAFSSPGVCCLTPSSPGEISFQNQYAIVALNGYFTNQFVSAASLVACQLTIQSGQATGWDQTGGTTDWSGGTVTMVKIQTVYLDMATNTLMVFSDSNDNGIVDPGELLSVAVGVMDFQVALGYDFNPANGEVSAVVGGINDEWLYNAVGEAFGAGVFALSSFTKASLLLVSPGVILGVTDISAATNWGSFQIQNGPVRGASGWSMRSEVTQLAPRNSYVFQ